MHYLIISDTDDNIHYAHPALEDQGIVCSRVEGRYWQAELTGLQTLWMITNYPELELAMPVTPGSL